MEGRTCALQGCSKPCTDPHLACGENHHLLLMAGRYTASHPYQLILDRNTLSLCALPSCPKPPWPTHSWCSRTHYLAWLNDFYTRLSPTQICKLPNCTRHVFVEETTDGIKLPYDQFCGWRHRQKFVMRNALQQHPQPPPTQTDGGHSSSVKSLMHVFKHFALTGAVDPAGIKVDTDFFNKHPWDVLTEGMACCLIAQCKFALKRKSDQRDMVTKDHWHWKQNGPPKAKDGFLKKYFRYKKLRSKRKNDDEHCDDRSESYTMKEYSVDECKLYSLVKLCKCDYKQHKRKRVHNGSQDSVFPRLDGELLEFSREEFLMPAANIFEGLPPITELAFNHPVQMSPGEAMYGYGNIQGRSTNFPCG